MDGKQALLFVGIVAFAAIAYWQSQQPVHNHADFLVMVNGQPFDFNRAELMTPYANGCGDPRIKTHLHGDVGTVAHVHAAGQTWGDFFTNLGFNLNSTCLRTDRGTWCNDGSAQWRVLVNGQPSAQFDKQPINDMDRVLFSYGTEGPEELNAQFELVSREAPNQNKGASCENEGA